MTNTTTEVTGVTSQNPVYYKDLSYSLKEKYSVLNGIYDNEDVTLQLALLLEPRGENCYKIVSGKIEAILQADYKVQQYHDALYDAFELGEVYLINDIITIVGGVRRDLGLSPFLSSIKVNSVRDFLSLYITQPETNTLTIGVGDAIKVKKAIIGYKPIFKLKPEEV